MSDSTSPPTMGELQKQQHPAHNVPILKIRALNFRPKTIALGTYIVFARSSDPPHANGEKQKPATAPPPPRRHAGLVVDVHNHPNTSIIELRVQYVSRTRALGPGQRLALPIAGPTNTTANKHASTDTGADSRAGVLHVNPDGQQFPWDDCIQWTTCERGAWLRVVTQYECNGTRRVLGGRCRLMSASLLHFAEAAEEGCTHDAEEGPTKCDIAETVPVDIWFNLSIADVIHDAWE
jgi:hypothetical protein